MGGTAGGGSRAGCISSFLPLRQEHQTFQHSWWRLFFGRKMLAHGWINWSSSGRRRGWEGLCWISVLLAGFSLLFLLAGLVFCILILCDFIWKFHMQWDITLLFQMKLDCSYIGSIAELQRGDNAKYFPALAWVHIFYFSPQRKCVLESPQLVAFESCFNSVCRIASRCSFPLSRCTHIPFLLSVLVGWAFTRASPAAVEGAVLDTLALQT